MKTNGGIALLSTQEFKIKSATGYHVRIIEKTAQLLGDQSIAEIDLLGQAV